MNFAAINEAALPSAHAICRRLFPGGVVKRNEYVALAPHRADRRLGSFSINVRTGKWADFASGDKGGDLVALVAYREGCSQGEAARLLAQLIGFDLTRGAPK